MTEIAQTICGIVMPISEVDDVHTVDHWKNVRAVLEEAIKEAGCIPQAVWEAGDFEVIQGGILQNIYENDILICDISTRNPNVMLEWGLRLTTKKPTLVVAEIGTPLPFDTNIVKVSFYDRKLEWSSSAKFIKELSEIIQKTLDSVKRGAYRPYLEHFQFETVQPATITVTAEQRVESQIERILHRLEIFDANLRNRLVVEQDADLRMTEFENVAPYPKMRNALLSAIDGQPNSTFLTTLVPGDKVYHDKFGIGYVSTVDSNKVDVNFEREGSRKVIASFLRKLPF